MDNLQKRRELYGIPDLPYQPFGENVIIFRLPNETMTAGGLYIPGTAEEPKPQGVLIGAGLAARDKMADGDIEIGDVVYFAKYAGWEKHIKDDPGNKGKDIIQMKVQDILGSEDSIARLSGPNKTREIKRDNDPESESYGQHFYEEIK